VFVGLRRSMATLYQVIETCYFMEISSKIPMRINLRIDKWFLSQAIIIEILLSC